MKHSVFLFAVLFGGVATISYAKEGKRADYSSYCNKAFQAKVVAASGTGPATVKFNNGVKRQLSAQESEIHASPKTGSRLCLQDDAD